MRDRTRSRNYSPEGEEFRREHRRHRDWGLTQRYARKLRRLHADAPDSPLPSATHAALDAGAVGSSLASVTHAAPDAGAVDFPSSSRARTALDAGAAGSPLSSTTRTALDVGALDSPLPITTHAASDAETPNPTPMPSATSPDRVKCATADPQPLVGRGSQPSSEKRAGRLGSVGRLGSADQPGFADQPGSADQQRAPTGQAPAKLAGNHPPGRPGNHHSGPRGKRGPDHPGQIPPYPQRIPTWTGHEAAADLQGVPNTPAIDHAEQPWGRAHATKNPAARGAKISGSSPGLGIMTSRRLDAINDPDRARRHPTPTGMIDCAQLAANSGGPKESLLWQRVVGGRRVRRGSRRGLDP